MGEFILDYADARASEDPADMVLEFLQDTYSAAADLREVGSRSARSAGRSSRRDAH